MRSFMRVVPVVAVALILFSLPAAVDKGTVGLNPQEICFPFLC